MSLEQLLMLVIFVITFTALIRFQRIPEYVFAGTMLACLAFSFVGYKDVLSNAVNPGLVTLVLLVICSFTFERTSVLRRISSMLFNGNKTKSVLKMLFLTAFTSALMNNTAVVASLINTVKRNNLINPGKLLLPLSFIAILGGTFTLVGTSTNLIVNSMFIEKGHSGFQFFDFTVVGLTAFSICLLVILITMRKLPEMPKEALSTHEYLLEAAVQESSSLIGKTVADNGLRNLDSLFLVELVRNGRLITPVEPEDIIQSGDKLIFTGDISKVKTLQQFDGLTLYAEQDGLLRDNLTEVLVKPGAAITGKTLKHAGFRARFDAAVVAIRREGTALSGKLGEIRIKSGDFLVLAVGQDFSTRTNLSKNFYILSGHTPDNMLSGWRDHLVVYGFLSVILLSVFTSMALVTGLIFYLSILVATNCLTVNEVKRRFPLEIWMIVLGALTLAQAMSNTGVAGLISIQIESLLQGQSVYIAFIGIFIAALLATELMTNSAAAALIFPIAYSIAIGLNVSPLPFVMAVAFGASGSFISPYGYQTNVMVFNAGNYKIKDFVRFGWPVSLTYCVVVIYLIPKVFPFN